MTILRKNGCLWSFLEKFECFRSNLAVLRPNLVVLGRIFRAMAIFGRFGANFAVVGPIFGVLRPNFGVLGPVILGFNSHSYRADSHASSCTDPTTRGACTVY